MPSPTPLLPADPTTLGRYRLVGRLGAGGMGTVYLGRGPDGASVAVKVVHERLAGDPQFLARFATEAAAARRVAGFCTARVIEAEVRGPRPYLVTEYVDGPTLREVLAARGPLSGSQVEALAVGVAAALTAIHAAGVVHRDLKPSNVLLSTFGPKVIDFGIAKALGAAAVATELGLVVGTLGWMAPEQLRGSATAASDVYVWGLLIASAGTGWHPQAELRVTAPAATELSTLPPALAAAVSAALHPDPARRPTARDLLLRLCGSAEPGPVRSATAVLSRPWAASDRIGPYPTARPAAWRPAPRPPASRPFAPPPLRQPPRRRRRWYLRKRVLLPVLALVALLLLNAADQGRDPATALPPNTARDGILEFTVVNWECGRSTLGPPELARSAQGQLCTVDLRVRNFGDQARRVDVGSQKLLDTTGRRFDADTNSWVYLPESVPFFQQEINPGNEVTGTLVYDIAKDARAGSLEVHDSPFSGGASIRL